MELKDIIIRLELLERYDIYADGDEEYPSVYNEKFETGDWVKFEDVEKLINEIKSTTTYTQTDIPY